MAKQEAAAFNKNSNKHKMGLHLREKIGDVFHLECW